MKGWLKSHSWAKKRFKITKNGKVFAKKSCNNHLLTNKWDTNKKSPYGKEVQGANAGMIKKIIPYK